MFDVVVEGDPQTPIQNLTVHRGDDPPPQGGGALLARDGGDGADEAAGVGKGVCVRFVACFVLLGSLLRDTPHSHHTRTHRYLATPPAPPDCTCSLTLAVSRGRVTSSAEEAASAAAANALCSGSGGPVDGGDIVCVWVGGGAHTHRRRRMRGRRVSPRPREPAAENSAENLCLLFLFFRRESLLGVSICRRGAGPKK